MAISFTGRVVNPKSLDLLYPCYMRGDYTGCFNICVEALKSFRSAIEPIEVRTANPLPVFESSDFQTCFSRKTHKDESGKVIQFGIHLDIKDSFISSLQNFSFDVILGSLGHELGHFYVWRLENLCNKSIHILWNELLSDFLSGFLYGLDQDNNPATSDLNQKGRLTYFPNVRDVNVAAMKKKTGKVYADVLDGAHPFTEARVVAIAIGFSEGCKLSTTPLPIGLKHLASLFDDFMESFYQYLITDQAMRSTINNLYTNAIALVDIHGETYQGTPKDFEQKGIPVVIPPKPTFFLK